MPVSYGRNIFARLHPGFGAGVGGGGGVAVCGSILFFYSGSFF